MVAGFLLTLEYGVASAGGARSWSDKFTSLLAEFGIYGPEWMKNEYIDCYAALLQIICVSIVLCGISAGKRFINTITCTKICVVLLIIVVGLGHFQSEHFHPFVPPSETNAKGEVVYGLPGIMLGASASFYGYIGYDEVCCLAGEAKHPAKHIPKAVMGTVIGASVLSTMATLVLVGMQQYNEIDSAAAYGKAFESIGLNFIKRVVETGEVITMPVGVLIGFLAQPRLQYAMAKDGLLPPIFARVDEKRNIFWGTLISGASLAFISLVVEFEILWDFISLGILLAFNMTNASVVIVRCRKNRPILAPVLLASYFVLSFLAAMLWQKGVVAHHLNPAEVATMSAHVRQLNVVLAWILSIVSCGLVVSIWKYCPQIHTVSSGFRAPLVPFTPCVAIFFNWFLFAQMQWFSIFMIVVWISLAVILYLIYGSRHSTSRQQTSGGTAYEMVARETEKSKI